MNSNKIALVTGGSRGLGRDMAIQLVKRGLKVVITYNANKTAAEVALSEIKSNGGEGLVLQLDTRDTSGFESFKNNLTEELHTKWITS